MINLDNSYCDLIISQESVLAKVTENSKEKSKLDKEEVFDIKNDEKTEDTEEVDFRPGYLGWNTKSTNEETVHKKQIDEKKKYEN